MNKKMVRVVALALAVLVGLSVLTGAVLNLVR
jgi:hypothetical protein